MPKNIVVFADGTGQEGGVGNNTNVYDLFNVIEDRTERQVSYYDKGLGTDLRRKVSGSIAGFGISQNVKECYNFIFSNYNAGDQIYLIGFSRGATTVRTLAAFIHRFGILPQSRPELIDRAWSIYKIRNKDKRRKKAEEFLRVNHTIWTRIRFVGVWDTVAALGLPNKLLTKIVDLIPRFGHSFHDLRLAKSVDYARHALAIDDERTLFHPTLWDETEDDRPTENGNTALTGGDIIDVYPLCEKLRTAAIAARSNDNDKSDDGDSLPESADPLSRILEAELRKKNPELLETICDFEPEMDREEDRRKISEIQNDLADFFNDTVRSEKSLLRVLSSYVKGDSLYNTKDKEKLAGITLSEGTQALIKERESGGTLRPSKRRRLNRLILEDAYALKGMTFPRVKQVWFAGMHTDVGGGYAERGLAHIPLLWMLNEAMELGLLIYEEHKTEIRPDPQGLMHDSRAKNWERFVYSRRVRSWNADKNRGHVPLVHESVVLRNRSESLGYDPWILKMKHDVEPWPQSLRSSVQWDDHYVWREAFWGWGGGFVVDWRSIQHISFEELSRTLTLHLHDDIDRDDITVDGSLGAGMKELLTEFGRRRAQALDDKQDREVLNEVVTTLKGEMRKLETELSELKAKRSPRSDGKKK